MLGFSSDRHILILCMLKILNHKALETLRVLLEGTAMEMCLLFIQNNHGV